MPNFIYPSKEAHYNTISDLNIRYHFQKLPIIICITLTHELLWICPLFKGPKGHPGPPGPPGEQVSYCYVIGCDVLVLRLYI